MTMRWTGAAAWLALASGCATEEEPVPPGGEPGALNLQTAAAHCLYPVVEVAAGQDVTVNWANLATDVNGDTLAEPLEAEHVPVLHNLAVDAATAVARCGDIWNLWVDIRPEHLGYEEGVFEPGTPQVTIPASVMAPDGGAGVLDISDRDAVGSVLLLPTAASTVTEVVL